MTKDTKRYGEPYCIENVSLKVKYYEDDNGERHYNMIDLYLQIENHIVSIISKHHEEGIKINKKFLDFLDEWKEEKW